VEPPRGARTLVLLELDGNDSDFLMMVMIVMVMVL
jgi:hypothetical protein